MTTLYRNYDKNGLLLYVGIAEDESRRRKEHKSTSTWFKHTASITVEEHESRGAARLAEKEAIDRENPLHNKAGRPSTKIKHPIRAIRLEDATWKKLVKLSAPENVSILVRKILRDYVGKRSE